MTEPHPLPDREPDGVGDPVCWLDAVCPACGAYVGAEAVAAGSCWRCDGPQPPAAAQPPAAG